MTKTLLITGTFDEKAKEVLQSQGYKLEVHGPRDLLSEDLLIQTLADKDGYILGGDEVATDRVISSTSRLKVIAFLGTGHQSFIDVQAASRKGIAVTNTPGANKQAVAEMAIGLMLAARRKIPFLNERTRHGEWRTDQVRNLHGQVLGIVGMGAIGKTVAEIAHFGLGMQILYYSQSRKSNVESKVNAVFTPINQLLSSSDVISLHVSYDPQNPTTGGLIGERELALMKPNAILVNTARAQLVDGEALRDALRDRKIGAAAFDGYYTEPNPPSVDNDPYGLLKLSDAMFIITPHIAWRTVDSDVEMCAMAAESVIDILSQRNMERVVNPEYASQAGRSESN